MLRKLIGQFMIVLIMEKNRFYTEIIKDHKPGGFGKITIKEVFEKSSNIE